MTLYSPRLSKSNVAHADRGPSEECRETGESEKPVENSVPGTHYVDVRDGAKGEHRDDGPERPSTLVNVGEDLGCVTSLGEGGKYTRSGVDAGETDRKNGNADDDVEETVESLKTGERGHDDERRGTSSGTSSEQSLVVVGNVETDDQERGDVDNGDTPESTLDGRRERFARVGSFGSGESDKFSSGERESSRDEYSADTLETVTESSGVAPVLTSDVFGVRSRLSTSDVENDTDNDEDDDSSEFETRTPEFFFSVTKSTENVDSNDSDPEDRDPNSYRHCCCFLPVLHCDTSSSNFKR